MSSISNTKPARKRTRVGRKEYALTILAIVAGISSTLLHAGMIEFNGLARLSAEEQPLPPSHSDPLPEPDPEHVRSI